MGNRSLLFQSVLSRLLNRLRHCYHHSQSRPCRMSRVWVRSMLTSPGVKAIIIETFGAGNAPTAEWLLDELQTAANRGVVLVNVTQCRGGSVLLGYYETSSALAQIPLIDGRDITTEAALAKLMYLLGEGISPKSFQTIFESSLRGEMS